MAETGVLKDTFLKKLSVVKNGIKGLVLLVFGCGSIFSAPILEVGRLQFCLQGQGKQE